MMSDVNASVNKNHRYKSSRSRFVSSFTKAFSFNDVVQDYLRCYRRSSLGENVRGRWQILYLLRERGDQGGWQPTWDCCVPPIGVAPYIIPPICVTIAEEDDSIAENSKKIASCCRNKGIESDCDTKGDDDWVDYFSWVRQRVYEQKNKDKIADLMSIFVWTDSFIAFDSFCSCTFLKQKNAIYCHLNKAFPLIVIFDFCMCYYVAMWRQFHVNKCMTPLLCWTSDTLRMGTISRWICARFRFKGSIYLFDF